LARCKELGLRAAALSMWPNGKPDPVPEEDGRFWAAALDIDMKMTPHGSFGGPIKPYEGVSREGAVCASGALGWPCTGTIGRLMLYVFDEFPQLRFYFAETQGAWLAHALNWMDEFYLRWYRYHDLQLKKMPSQYYRDHCRFSFIHDRVVMQLRQFIDPALLMWAGNLAQARGETTQAIEFFRRAVASDPVNAQAIAFLATGLSAVGRQEEARTEYARVIELNPSAPNSHAGVGLTYLLQGKFEEAAVAAQKDAADWARLLIVSCARWAQKRVPESEAALAELRAKLSELGA